VAFLRRRARATKPPRAAIKPGSPAPTIGPGTALQAISIVPFADDPTVDGSAVTVYSAVVANGATELATVDNVVA
jgi:hypothetical protein